MRLCTPDMGVDSWGASPLRENQGTSRKQAIFAAISRKSYWRLSKTLAMQSGMTNQWLKTQGLLSFLDLWMQAHGYA